MAFRTETVERTGCRLGKNSPTADRSVGTNGLEDPDLIYPRAYVFMKRRLAHLPKAVFSTALSDLDARDPSSMCSDTP